MPSWERAWPKVRSMVNWRMSKPEGHLRRLPAVSASLGPPRRFGLGVHLGWLRGLLQQTRCREEWDLAYARQVHHMIRADHDDHGLHAVVRLQLLAWVGQPRVLLITCPKDRWHAVHATALSIRPASIACAPWRSRLFFEDRGGDPAMCCSCSVLRARGVGLPLGPPLSRRPTSCNQVVMYEPAK